jgi:hypothetical protein
MPVSNFFHKLGFKLHGAKAVNLAIDVVVAFDQADVFDFGAHFHDRGRAFDLQVFDQSHGVAVLQHIAVGIFPNFGGFSRWRFSGVPFMAATGADQQIAIGVTEFVLAMWARGKCVHGVQGQAKPELSTAITLKSGGVFAGMLAAIIFR